MSSVNITVSQTKTSSDVINLWPIIKPGFDDILKYTDETENLDSILYKLITKEIRLYVLFADEIYCGFITLGVRQSQVADKITNYLLLDHMYIVPQKQHLGIPEEVNCFIEDMARESGCTTIKTYSTRNIEKRLVGAGYHKTYTEYVKHLGDNSESL